MSDDELLTRIDDEQLDRMAQASRINLNEELMAGDLNAAYKISGQLLFTLTDISRIGQGLSDHEEDVVALLNWRLPPDDPTKGPALELVIHTTLMGLREDWESTIVQCRAALAAARPQGPTRLGNNWYASMAEAVARTAKKLGWAKDMPALQPALQHARRLAERPELACHPRWQWDLVFDALDALYSDQELRALCDRAESEALTRWVRSILVDFDADRIGAELAWEFPRAAALRARLGGTFLNVPPSGAPQHNYLPRRENMRPGLAHLLQCLQQQPSWPVPFEVVIDAVWDRNDPPTDKTVQNSVAELNNHLEGRGHPWCPLSTADGYIHRAEPYPEKNPESLGCPRDAL